MKSRPFDRFNAAIVSIEKNLAGLLFLLMSVVVLADVLHRIFSRTPGRIASLLSGWFPNFWNAADPQIIELLDQRVDRLLMPIVFFVVALFAIRTRARALHRPLTWARSCVQAALGSLVLGLSIIAFIKWIPSGLVWSPYFGLTCLVWLGLLGASIAADQGQHLALEMGEKIWPEKIRPIINKIAAILTGCFCAWIAVLAFLSVHDHYVDWSSGPEAGLIPSIEWPKWMVYSVIPYSFGMMAFRFWGRAFSLLSEPEKKGIL
jgi:TRAP-type C4-dicarboxylate transport system permease small subunit